jgi:hypothetical protein
MSERVQSELENFIIQGIKVSGEMLGKLKFMKSPTLIFLLYKKNWRVVVLKYQGRWESRWCELFFIPYGIDRLKADDSIVKI